jgi:hypothetical protein
MKRHRKKSVFSLPVAGSLSNAIHIRFVPWQTTPIEPATVPSMITVNQTMLNPVNYGMASIVSGCLVWLGLHGLTRLDAAVSETKAALGHPSTHGPVKSAFHNGLIILLIRYEFHQVQSVALTVEQAVEGIVRMAEALQSPRHL